MIQVFANSALKDSLAHSGHSKPLLNHRFKTLLWSEDLNHPYPRGEKVFIRVTFESSMIQYNQSNHIQPTDHLR
jgi:hypothetical protein